MLSRRCTELLRKIVKAQAIVRMAVTRNRFFEKKWQLEKATLVMQKCKSLISPVDVTLCSCHGYEKGHCNLQIVRVEHWRTTPHDYMYFTQITNMFSNTINCFQCNMTFKVNLLSL